LCDQVLEAQQSSLRGLVKERVLNDGPPADWISVPRTKKQMKSQKQAIGGLFLRLDVCRVPVQAEMRWKIQEVS
jgi:hypothetical protein